MTSQEYWDSRDGHQRFPETQKTTSIWMRDSRVSAGIFCHSVDYYDRVFMAEMMPPTSTPKPITEISGSGLLAGGRLVSSWFMAAGSGRWNLNPAILSSRFLGLPLAAL